MGSRRSTRVAWIGVGIAALGTLAFGGSAAAAPTTVPAVLTLNGVQTADAPGGTGSLTVTTGDAVQFSIARPDRISQAAGYWVMLDAHTFPGAPKSVKLTAGKTWTLHIDTSGRYAFTWAAYNALGAPIKLHGGEYTWATLIAQAPASSPSATPTATGSGTWTPPGTALPTGGHAVAGISMRHGGLALPPPDTGSATTSSPARIAAADIPSQSTSVPAPAAVAGPTGDPSLADLASVSAHRAARPTGLAIAAILALALVTTVWAYQYMGLPVPARASRWLNRTS